MSETGPVAYLVTERRQGDVLLGDDWTQRCDNLDDAREVAARWREHGVPFEVVILAIAEVPS